MPGSRCGKVDATTTEDQGLNQGSEEEALLCQCQQGSVDAVRANEVSHDHAGGKKDSSLFNGVLIHAVADEVDSGATEMSEDAKMETDSEPNSSDTENGTDEVDFSFLPGKRLSLLQSCVKRELAPKMLDKILQSLKNQKVDERENLDDIDQFGYAAIHYIVTKIHKSKSTLLEKLVTHGADVDLTATCREGLSALHLAVEAKSLECVKALISLDADVNIETSMGVTPLDIAIFSGRLDHSSHRQDNELAKLNLGHEISTKEFPKQSKLDQEFDKDTKAIIKVLESVGAVKGSSSDSRSRSPSSHKSKATNSRAHCKIDTNYYRELHDRIREKIMKAAINSEVALTLMKDLKEHQQYRKEYGSRILCLDGGGMRGLLQITVLREIERQMKMRIVDLFDWVVGTSTGGIIALALTYGTGQEKMGQTTSQLRNLYWLRKDEIFGKCPLCFLSKGNTEKLEDTLKSWLGSDTKLCQKPFPKVLVPAVCKKDSNLGLHVFNNCFNNQYSEELVWKVGRYTSAAPLYFTEFEDYIDGGMLANNPSETALTLIQDHYHEKGEKIPISLLVSVGSGINPGSPLGKMNINPQAFMAVLESSILNGEQINKSCQSRCREQGIEYFRFNPQLSQKVDPNQHESAILQEMVFTTRKYLGDKSVKKEIDRLVQLLKDSKLATTENTSE